MKVQVTKDNWGVVAWPMDEEIEFKGCTGDRWKQEPDFEAAWCRKGFTIFQSHHQVFTEKQMKSMFPDVCEFLKVGERMVMDLQLVKA